MAMMVIQWLWQAGAGVLISVIVAGCPLGEGAFASEVFDPNKEIGGTFYRILFGAAFLVVVYALFKYFGILQSSRR